MADDRERVGVGGMKNCIVAIKGDSLLLKGAGEVEDLYEVHCVCATGIIIASVQNAIQTNGGSPEALHT